VWYWEEEEEAVLVEVEAWMVLAACPPWQPVATGTQCPPV